ncbi:MAG: energy transducer TonB [Vicinamibacterales bacterium]
MRGYWARPSATPEEIDDPFYGVRTFIVPPGIVPVKRTSPIPVRKRTPWHPRPGGDQTIDRAGGRDWFGAHLTLESQRQHKPATYGMAGVAHVVAVLGVIAVVFREAPSTVPEISQPFMVPVLLSLPTASKLYPPPKPASQLAQATPEPPLALPIASPVIVEREEPQTSAPTESPDGVKPESEVRAAGAPDGVEGGTPGGVSGGVPGGQLDGIPRASKVAASGPLRLGPGIERPRKIKDVKPVYPQGALTGQLRGTVVIEATIGIDGKVLDARVLRSIAGLDQAALDAVRQWEFAPARLNGAPVAVIMTVSVAFMII